MLTPIWVDKSISYAAMDEGSGWTQSAFLHITKDTSAAVLESAVPHMSKVQCVRVARLGTNAQCALVQLFRIANLSNLQCLIFENWDGLFDTDVRDLIALLQCAKHVQQLSVLVKLDSNEVAKELFDVMATLPLIAISMAFVSSSASNAGDLFFDILQLKQNELVSLEVQGINCMSVWPAICSRLAGPKLRLLRLYLKFDAAQMQSVLKSVATMPFLQTLYLNLIKGTVPLAERFFCESFRPIKHLQLSCGLDVRSSDVVPLFVALRRNTKLRSIAVSQHLFDAVSLSELVEEGYLTDASPLHHIKHKRLLQQLQRNRALHNACMRACVALIAARRSKRTLQLVPFDLVRAIAMWLWETRNQKIWDENDNDYVRKNIKNNNGRNKNKSSKRK